MPLLWLTMALGCGPTIGVMPGGGGSTDDAGSTGEMAGPDTDGAGTSDGGVGSTADSTGSSTGADDEGSDTTEPPPIDACIDDGQLARAVAVADTDAQTVTVVEPGGEASTWSAALPAGVEHPAFLAMAAREDFVAVGTGYSSGGEVGTVVRLFDRIAGGLVWESELSGHRLGNVYVDGQGRVVISAQWSAAPSFAGVLLVDGVPTAMPTFEPAGPIDIDGWISGRFANQGGALGGGFYDPVSETLVTVVEGQPAGYRASEGAIEFIDQGVGIPRLVIATPTGQSEVLLEPFADAQNIVTTMARAGDYRLLATSGPNFRDPPSLLRVHVPTGETVVVDATPPEGWVYFDCYNREAEVDVAGRVLFELRTDGVAQMHAYDPMSATWEALGEAVTGVEDILTVATFGTVHHIVTHAEGQTFCPQVMWADAGYAPSGGSSQLARVDPPFVAFVEQDGIGSATVDPEEQCASWVEDGVLRIHDIDDGDEVTVAGRGPVLWLP